MNDDVGPESDGALQVWRQESVVHDKHGIVLGGELSHGSNVGDAKSGIGGRFDVQHARDGG